MKAVFDVRAGSKYDDDITGRYHFPSRYLAAAERARGDWVLFRETRRGGGGNSYFAMARIDRIEPDPTTPGHHYAFLTDYREFVAPVPFARDGRFAEAVLRALPSASMAGPALRGNSVRILEQEDFAAIVAEGLAGDMAPADLPLIGLTPEEIDATAILLLDAAREERQRRIEEVLVSRKIRDAAFRRLVGQVYDYRCAATGLRIVAPGGWPEVQAAHVWSVADGGPDTIRNGLALSGTAHWLFDRHMISVSEDYGLLVREDMIPRNFSLLFERQKGRLMLPEDKRLWPRPEYLEKHRVGFAAA